MKAGWKKFFCGKGAELRRKKVYGEEGKRKF